MPPSAGARASAEAGVPHRVAGGPDAALLAEVDRADWFGFSSEPVLGVGVPIVPEYAARRDRAGSSPGAAGRRSGPSTPNSPA